MTIPDELRSTPRRVLFTARGKAFVAFLAFVAAGAALGSMWLSAKSSRGRARVARHAAEMVTVPGKILTAKRRSSGKSSYWAMTYRFSAAERDLDGRMTWGQPIPVGTAVTVGYMPFNPGDNWIMGHEPKPVSIWAGPLVSGFVFIVVGSVLFRLRRRFLLLSNGDAAIGHATGKSSSYATRSGPHYRWKYEFKAASGGIITKKMDSASKPPAADTELIVLYDSGQPENATLYPDLLMRVEVAEDPSQV